MVVTTGHVENLVIGDLDLQTKEGAPSLAFHHLGMHIHTSCVHAQAQEERSPRRQPPKGIMEGERADQGNALPQWSWTAPRIAALL